MVSATDRDVLVKHTSEVVSALCFDHLVSAPHFRWLGRGLVEALRGEAREELNVVLSSDAVFLGGWQQKRAQDERVNVNFSVFGVTSQTLDFAVDQSEITEARWLPLRDFPTREELC